MPENNGKIRILNDYNRPTLCKSCGGIMVYKGLGEYQCEDCQQFDYDDYGKVRNYLDKHTGANVAEISSATGVTHKAIREMIKENRFEVIDNRGGYIRCEMCGKNIKSGRLCESCEILYHRQLEEEARGSKKSNISGYGEGTKGDEGHIRYTRNR